MAMTKTQTELQYRPATAVTFKESRLFSLESSPAAHPATAAAVLHTEQWTRAFAPTAPSPLDPTYSNHEEQLSPLEFSEDYNDAEDAIDSIIVPLLQNNFQHMAFVVTLVMHKQEAKILVGVTDPAAVLPHLGVEYGGLAILLVHATTESRTTPVGLDLVKRTADRNIGASISSLRSRNAGTLGMFVRHRPTKAVCGLTAYHVISDNHAVVCPAEGDAQPLVEYLQSFLPALEKVISFRQSKHLDSAMEQDSLNKMRKQVAALDTGKTFGRVLAFDFHAPTRDEPFYSDCALFAVEEAEAIDFRRFMADDPAWSVTRFLSPDNSQVKRNDRLTMMGRTSGRQVATKNEYMLRLSMNMHTGLLSEKFNCWGAWDENHRFTAAGDSGAVIMKEEEGGRAAVGIVVGGSLLTLSAEHGHRQCDVTFFQPVTEAAHLLDFEVLGYDFP